MSKKRKLTRQHTITVDVPEPRYRRWEFVNNSTRVLLIDFRCIRHKSETPNYGAERVWIWKNPQQLQQMVDSYFASCYGPIRNPKTGGFYENPDGSLVQGQVKPFTISGLAIYCHISTKEVRDCAAGRIDARGFPTDEDYVGPTYSEIMLRARQRIEAYAEEQLYSKDGFGGGRYILDAAFKWLGAKEKAEIEAMKKQVELKQKELKLKKKQAALGDEAEEPVTITIKRAGTGAEDD